MAFRDGLFSHLHLVHRAGPGRHQIYRDLLLSISRWALWTLTGQKLDPKSFLNSAWVHLWLRPLLLDQMLLQPRENSSSHGIPIARDTETLVNSSDGSDDRLTTG